MSYNLKSNKKYVEGRLKPKNRFSYRLSCSGSASAVGPQRWFFWRMLGRSSSSSSNTGLQLQQLLMSEQWEEDDAAADVRAKPNPQGSHGAILEKRLHCEPWGFRLDENRLDVEHETATLSLYVQYL